MMGNAVQCAVWCESQYDVEATSGGYRAEDRIRDTWKIAKINKMHNILFQLTFILFHTMKMFFMVLILVLVLVN